MDTQKSQIKKHHLNVFYRLWTLLHVSLKNAALKWLAITNTKKHQVS